MLVDGRFVVVLDCVCELRQYDRLFITFLEKQFLLYVL